MGSLSLGTGLRALLTAQGALDTIGHNLANAGTPGYSRQRLDLVAAQGIRRGQNLIGNGVDLRSIRRATDGVLERRILSQLTTSGRFNAQVGQLFEVETVLGELEGASIGGLMSDAFASISALSASPADGILRSDVVQNFDGLAARFRELDSSLNLVTHSALDQVEVHVERINELSEQIADLNDAIAQAEASGLVANDMRDQRDGLLKEMADLADVEVREFGVGGVRVLVAGNQIVGPGGARALDVESRSDGSLGIVAEGVNGFLPQMGGRIQGLLDVADGFVPGVREDLDALARELILSVNRVHSTGVPGSGPFTQLIGTNAITDQNGNQDVLDERLVDAGLPFQAISGSFYVNVTDLETGNITKHEVPVDAANTSVGDVLDAINDIPNMTADIDAFGRMNLRSNAGYGFDFSPRLDTLPDDNGTFGGGAASLGTNAAEPYALTNGDTLDFSVSVGGVPTPVSVSFSTADFADIGNATAEEIAQVIQNDPGAQAAGLTAVSVEGRLYLQSAGSGSTESFDLVGGSAVTALDLGASVGTTITGHDEVVAPKISGEYTGEGNGKFTFVPVGDGTIGTTPGLAVEVFDETGLKVATLDVGEGYEPGTTLPVAEGVEVSFDLGVLSASDGDRFTLDVVEDADTSDALVALGLNSLLVGSSSQDIQVRDDILDNPQLFAGSYDNVSGGNGALLDLLAVENLDSVNLQGYSVGEFYSNIVSDIGFETSSAQNAQQVSDGLLESFQLRREQVSGVNVDEELVDMIQFEQSYQAAVQFLSTVNQLQDELLGML